MIDRDAFKIGIDIDSAKKDVNELLKYMEESLERVNAGGLSAKQMDAEIKKMRLHQQQVRVADEVLRAAEKEAKVLQQRLALEEKLQKSAGTSVAVLERVLNFAGEMGLAGQQADWRGWIGSATSRFAGQALGHIPVVGGFLRDVANIYANEQQRQEERADLRYTLFRDVGPAGRRAFMAADRPGALQDIMIGLGASVQDRATAIRALGAAGVNPGEGLLPLVALQQGFGLGGQGGAMMQAITRGGGTQQDAIDALGTAIGVAAGTELDRGRWGEAFDNISKAASQVTSGTANVQNIAELQAAVGLMGPGFRGAGPAGVAMQQGLQALSMGQGGPLAQITSLQAAGFGGGAGYFTALYRTQLGITGGGLRESDLRSRIKEFADQMGARDIWAAGNEEGKNYISYVVWTSVAQSVLTLPQVRAYLDSIYFGAAASSRIEQALSIGRQYASRLRAGAVDVSPDISTRRAAALGGAINRGDFSGVPMFTPDWMRSMILGAQQDAQGSGLGDAWGVSGDVSPRSAAARGQAIGGSSPAALSRQAIFGAGGTPGRFRSSTERWRNLIGIVGPSYGFSPQDTDFLLSWIQRESGGGNSRFPVGDTSILNERGLFQVMGSHGAVIDRQGQRHKAQTYAQSEAAAAGIPESLFNISDRNPLATVQVGMMLVASRRRQAQALASRYHLDWSSTDMNKLTKYLHAMPAGAYRDLAHFDQSFGRPPANFEELSRVVTPKESAWFRQASEVGALGAPRLDININVTGGTVSASTSRGGQTVVGRVLTNFRHFAGF